MDKDAEVSLLKRRLSELEGEVRGEKDVSRHILRKVGENENLLLEMRRELSRLGDNVALLRAEFTGFQEKLPGIVSDAMREVMSTQRK